MAPELTRRIHGAFRDCMAACHMESHHLQHACIVCFEQGMLDAWGGVILRYLRIPVCVLMTLREQHDLILVVSRQCLIVPGSPDPLGCG